MSYTPNTPYRFNTLYKIIDQKKQQFRNANAPVPAATLPDLHDNEILSDIEIPPEYKIDTAYSQDPVSRSKRTATLTDTSLTPAQEGNSETSSQVARLQPATLTDTSLTPAHEGMCTRSP